VRTRKEAVAQAEARGLGPAAEIEATRA